MNLGDVNPTSNGGRATIGIRNAGALTNQQQIEWSFNAPALANASVLQFAGAAAKVVGDMNSDRAVSCAHVAIVKAVFGKRAGQAGFAARGDELSVEGTNVGGTAPFWARCLPETVDSLGFVMTKMAELLQLCRRTSWRSA